MEEWSFTSMLDCPTYQGGLGPARLVHLACMMMTAASTTAIMTTPPVTAEGVWERNLNGNSPVGLLVDGYRVHRAVAALHGVPRGMKLYALYFNSTGTGRHTWINDEVSLLQWASRLNDSREPPGTLSSAFLALREAIGVLPPGTTIVIITSRQPDDDEDITNDVLKSFIKNHVKLYVIWTGDSISEAPKGYQLIVKSTGGNIIQTDQGASLTMSHLTNNGSQVYEVILATKRNLQGEQTITFSVDRTILKFNVILVGAIVDSYLRSPGGSQKQLRQKETKLNAGPESVGKWVLQVKGNDYDITVEGVAINTLKTQVEKLPGVSTKSLLSVSTNYALKEITEMNLLDSRGRKVASFPKTNGSRERFLSQVELTSDLVESSRYVELTGKTNTGSDITRLSYINNKLPKLPSTIEVLPRSDLTAEPGQQASILFQVTNNRQYPVNYNFLWNDQNNLVRSVQPQRTYVEPEGTATVTVRLDTNVVTGELSNLISLTAEQEVYGWRKERVTKRALFRIGKKVPDSIPPDITSTYTGDCSGTQTPDNCYANTWGLDLTIQDPQSGLLQIKAEPNQLLFDEEFIVGSTYPLHGHITMSCCLTKVSLTVRDSSGNAYSKVYDINAVSLSQGELAAVILGAILLIIIIICVIIGIVYCIRKKKTVNYYVN